MSSEDFWFSARLRRRSSFENPVTEPKRPVRRSLGEGGSRKPKRPLSTGFNSSLQLLWKCSGTTDRPRPRSRHFEENDEHERCKSLDVDCQKKRAALAGGAFNQPHTKFLALGSHHSSRQPTAIFNDTVPSATAVPCGIGAGFSSADLIVCTSCALSSGFARKASAPTDLARLW